MGRIIGVDYGCKRTGIAVTDPLQMIAGGVETVPTDEVVLWLERYMIREDVAGIVVGNPVMLDGSESEMMRRHIRPFVERLRKRFPAVRTDTFDERYTSKLAVRAMTEGGMKKKDRRDKSNIDRVSATILLQSYLEAQRIHDAKF